MFNQVRFSLLGIIVAAVLALPTGAQGVDGKTNAGSDNLAIKGYDTVAYFTEGKPTIGKPEFSVSWESAQWRFVNARHRDLFAANPERYAPKFRGFCSMALTRGVIAVADPEAWAVIDGNLYLSYSEKGIDNFRQNSAENIKKAQMGWAEIRRQK